MGRLKKSTLASLNILAPDGAWESRGLTEKQGEEILTRLSTAHEWADDDWDEDRAAILSDIDEEYPAGKNDAQPSEPVEAEGQADGDGDEEGDSETEGEGFPQENEDEAEAKRDALDDYIVHVVKHRRDEVLEGIELGGGAGNRGLTVKRYDAPDVQFDHAHEMLPTLITAMAQREPVLMVGPAGSGKTTAILQAGEAFGVPARLNSNSRMDTYSKAFGYMDAGGTYRPGYMYEPMLNGEVLGDDEVDASNENVMVSKNTAIENRFAFFPNGEKVEAHDNFFYVGSANTYGRGADRVYVGRTQLDGATLDRFVVIEWEYDEELERMLAPVPEFTEFVQKVRHAVQEHKMRYIVSPRASIKGGKLLNAGLPERDVRKMVLFKGWPQDDLDKVMRAI